MQFSDAAAKWDKRYLGSATPLFGEEPNAWLAQASRLFKPKSAIVCVADGQGRNSTFLAGLGHSVQAFDISPVAISSLQQRAAQLGVSVQSQVCELDKWPWENDSLDVAVAVFIQFADPPARAALFANMKRAVRPGGLVVIEGYGLRQLRYRTGGPGVPENLYSAPMLLDAFSGWRVLSSRDADLDLAEGSGHLGRSHVVSAVLERPQ